MSWFSDEHKKLYTQALGALYEDVKSGANAIVDGTGKLITSGYGKIRDGVVYLDKKYNTEYTDKKCNSEDIDKNVVVDSKKIINENETSEIDISEDTDDYLLEIGKTCPDVLVKLNRDYNHIVKVWVIEKDGTFKPVRGKIESYQYISKLIYKWFIYESRNNLGCKWYPSDELYTAYRNSSNRLNSMDDIVFRYTQQGYKPFHYHPLF